jgi:gamma-glutamyltranspeptidase/glutathione hydrolase
VEHLRSSGGLLDLADLSDYTPKFSDQGLRGTYRSFEVLGVPGTAGGPVLQEMLNIIEGYDLKALGRSSATVLHLIAQASRRAYQDHFAFGSDPDSPSPQSRGILEKSYADTVRGTIRLTAPNETSRMIDPSTFAKDAPQENPHSLHTTHLCAVDKERNAVSLTQTLGLLFGSAVTVPGTGVLLNDQMVGFDPRPGHLNSVSGGKSRATPYAPTALMADGRLYAVLGAPGSRRIPSALAQVVVNLVDFGLGIQEAVSAPRLHAESERLELDSRFSPEIIQQLTALGNSVLTAEKTVCSFNFAQPSGIVITPDGRLRGGVDPTMPRAAAVSLN